MEGLSLWAAVRRLRGKDVLGDGKSVDQHRTSSFQKAAVPANNTKFFLRKKELFPEIREAHS